MGRGHRIRFGRYVWFLNAPVNYLSMSGLWRELHEITFHIKSPLEHCGGAGEQAARSSSSRGSLGGPAPTGSLYMGEPSAGSVTGRLSVDDPRNDRSVPGPLNQLFPMR